MAEDNAAAIADLLPLDQSITEAWAIYEQYDTPHSTKLAEEKADKSLYHSALFAFLSMKQAGFTLAPADLAVAKSATKRCFKVCNKIRGKKKLKNLLSKKSYTDLELHAEVTYALVSGSKALLSAHKCYAIQNLAKIALAVSKTSKVLHKMRDIADKRTTWESPLSKSTLESALRLENGLRQLIVSFLPPALLKLVGFLGFKGVREVALRELNITAWELNGLYSLMAQILLTGYWSVVEFHLCLGPQVKELEHLQKELEMKTATASEHSFQSFFYNLSLERIKLFKGLSANTNYIGLLEGFKKNESTNIIYQPLISWELAWQYAFWGRFPEAIAEAEFVRNKSIHSPPLTTFFEAIIRYTAGRLNGDQAQLDKASSLIESTQSMKVHYVGNTTTPEKAVGILAKRYFKWGKILILPLYDQIYHFNGHLFFEKNPEAAAKWLEIIEKEKAVFEKDSEHRERFLAALFYQGTVLKGQKKYAEASNIFKTILDESKSFKKLSHILVHSELELGLIALEQGKKDEAKEHLDATLKKYSGYITENIVLIKVYAALRQLGVSTDKTEPIEGVENLDDISNIEDASDDEASDDD